MLSEATDRRLAVYTRKLSSEAGARSLAWPVLRWPGSRPAPECVTMAPQVSGHSPVTATGWLSLSGLLQGLCSIPLLHGPWPPREGGSSPLSRVSPAGQTLCTASSQAWALPGGGELVRDGRQPPCRGCWEQRAMAQQRLERRILQDSGGSVEADEVCDCAGRAGHHNTYILGGGYSMLEGRDGTVSASTCTHTPHPMWEGRTGTV